MSHPLENMMRSAMEQLKALADVDTVVGKPVQIGNGTLVIPVSRVTLGFVSGGGEYGTKNPVLTSGYALEGDGRAYPFAGTMAAGLGLRPIAFLTVQEDRVRVLQAEETEPYARAAGMLPDLVAQVAELVSNFASRSRRCE